jgi:hypothetical protein
MVEKDKKRKTFPALVWLRSVVAITVMVLAGWPAVAQDPALAVPQNAVRTSAIVLRRLFGDGLSFFLRHAHLTAFFAARCAKAIAE